MEQTGPGNRLNSSDDDWLDPVPISHQTAAAEQPDEESPPGGNEVHVSFPSLELAVQGQPGNPSPPFQRG